jgi:hypothetical protein
MKGSLSGGGVMGDDTNRAEEIQINVPAKPVVM